MSSSANSICSDALYAEARNPVLADCHFYQSMNLPGVGHVPGEWDVLEDTGSYIGRVPLDGRRVLEIGPANGALTFFIESQGAEVVAVELPEVHPWDFVPLANLDMSQVTAGRVSLMEGLRNGFWLAHKAFDSKSKVHYGDAGHLPAELGMFDTSVMACILLHTRDPLGILNSCARRTTDCIVITELLEESLGTAPIAHLLPTVDNDYWHTWWSFSPGFFSNYLPAIGFADIEITRHSRLMNGTELKLFTVVARRGPEPSFSDVEARRYALELIDRRRSGSGRESGHAGPSHQSSPTGPMGHGGTAMPAFERFVPQASATLMAAEHIARYRLASQIVKGAGVLDAGCGAGYGSAMLQDGGARFVVGIDLNADAFLSVKRALRGDRAPESDEQAPFNSVGDLTRLPFADGSFDSVVCFEAIEHVVDPDAVLDELVRVLSPDGVLLASTPNGLVNPEGNPHHLFEYEPDEFRSALAKRFSHQKIIGQHPFAGSLIAFEQPNVEAGESGSGLAVDGESIKDCDVTRLVDLDPDNQQYMIAFASNVPLPELPAPVAVLGDAMELRWWHEQVEMAKGANAKVRDAQDAAARKLDAAAIERSFLSEQVRLLSDRLIAAEAASSTLLSSQAESDRLRFELDETARESKRLAHDSQRLQQELDRALANAAEPRDDRIADLEFQVSENRRYLEAILESATWRTLLPVRSVYGRLRSLSAKGRS